jgi:hypothetical protein
VRDRLGATNLAPYSLGTFHAGRQEILAQKLDGKELERPLVVFL